MATLTIGTKAIWRMLGYPCNVHLSYDVRNRL